MFVFTFKGVTTIWNKRVFGHPITNCACRKLKSNISAYFYFLQPISVFLPHLFLSMTKFMRKIKHWQLTAGIFVSNYCMLTLLSLTITMQLLWLFHYLINTEFTHQYKAMLQTLPHVMCSSNVFLLLANSRQYFKHLLFFELGNFRNGRLKPPGSLPWYDMWRK